MDKKKWVACLFAFLALGYWGLNGISASGGKEATRQANSEATHEFKTIAAGMDLPQFTLDAPVSEVDQKYLGLSEREPFSLSQISARIFVIEIFSMYCPHCRKQGPILNKIYKFIQEDKVLKNGVKMLGIMAAGDQSKVDKWKTTLHVPFPIFPDLQTTIWQKFGKPGVPCTLIVNISGKVLEVHYGASEDTEAFFRQIKKLYTEQK